MNLFFSTPEITNALSCAIAHSLWQGLLVFCILKILLHYIPENYSRFRYNTSVLSLLSITGWSIFTFMKHSNHAVKTYQTHIINTNTEIEPSIIKNETSFIPGVQHVSTWLTINSSLISTLYVIGISLFIIRILYNLYGVRALKQSGVSIQNSDWKNIYKTCIQQLGVKSNVQLLFSSKIDVPMAMGIIKPVVLVPIALVNQLSTTEVESILLHELAHIKRNDYLVNIIQLCLETILFFNPFIWLVSTIIRKEREKCCDDMVVLHSSCKLS